MTTKANLEALLPTVSKSAITSEGVTGKFCLLTYDGNNQWDVWVRHADYATGETLSERKLSAILNAIPLKANRLTGEAILTMTSEQVMEHAETLGLRKRRAATRLSGCVLNHQQNKNPGIEARP